ncbi:MAG: DNA-protecting protein DprA [Candidatus Cloacimonadota bacterium]|nr:MAG: DNA-protecting protein DprA [Candidatus Cloacimonadota bacterium]
MRNIADIKDWVSLLKAPELKNRQIRELIKIFGKPQSFLNQGFDIFKNCSFLTESQKKILADIPVPEEWSRIENLIDKFDIHFISFFDDDYPPLLKNIYEPPLFLFYRGKYERKYFKNCLGVVGTRKATSYGKSVIDKILPAVIKSGFTAVSGLASGIDSFAHETCVKNNRYNIAVMGTGCEKIYPAKNRFLAEKIIENGILFSEFLPGSEVERWNFPTRNRIISGLSRGVLVVEGGIKSGALLTARFALDQNRDLFAAPGDITRNQSAGPNYLLKQGAVPVCEPEDILEQYGFNKINEQQELFPELTGKEDHIFQILLENKPQICIDEIVVKSGLNISEVSSVLFMLEMKNVIKFVSGNKVAPLF